MLRLLILLSTSILFTASLRAELPQFYKTVDRLIWVVEDADATMRELRNIGFTNLEDYGDVEFTGGEYKGTQPTGSFRFISGRFGDVAAHWIQPHGGNNAFAEFLERRKSGVFSLMHRTLSAEAFDAEIARMADIGVGVLMQGSIDADAGKIRWAFFDTEREGKYSLGIIYFPGGQEGPLAIPDADPSGRVVTQYAFAVKKLEPVSEYWARLGFPPMEFTHGKLTDLKYRQRPANFDMRLGWQRHGRVVYEWIQSLKGPNVYLDHMKVHGEGLHHLAFNVDDMEADIAWWTGKGHPESMSGGWGEKGKPGSGRFAYVDAQAIGGTDIELLWNYKGE